MTYCDLNPPIPSLATHGFWIDADGQYHDEIGPFIMDVVFDETEAVASGS